MLTSPLSASTPGARRVEILLERVAASYLANDVTSQILALSEGVPLFVEELTKASLKLAC